MKPATMIRKLLLLFIAAVMTGCGDTPLQKVANTITEKSLMKPIKTLSADEFKGRSTGTEGEAKTIDYLVTQLQEYGVKDGMSDRSYVQEVPIVSQTNDQDTQVEISEDGQTISTLHYYTDFMAWPINMAKEVSIDEAELVYVGYGI